MVCAQAKDNTQQVAILDLLEQGVTLTVGGPKDLGV